MTSPFQYQQGKGAMILGVGLMGQRAAQVFPEYLRPGRLILVDVKPDIQVGTAKMSLADFGESLRGSLPAGTEVLTEVVDVTSAESVAAMFGRHREISHFFHTAGISPRPLTPPEQLTRQDVMSACEVNLWGTHNVIAQGVNTGAFVAGARGVLVLSTSGTVGSEGRASAAYEESKGALLNFLRLQARHFVEKYRLILNGIAPSPLRGPMAAQNEVSAGRLAAVENAMPLGALTNPDHIAAAALFFMAEACWAVGEVLTVDGGYTKHRPIYGPLPE